MRDGRSSGSAASPSCFQWTWRTQRQLALPLSKSCLHGSIDVWVNNAMATVFAPVEDVSPAEFRRVTEVTYLGQVHGSLAALRHMRRQRCGTIVQVGSALAYRSILLQSAYCAAKAAARGFTDSLRSELIREGSPVRLTMVHLPAVDTPQFDWREAVFRESCSQSRPFTIRELQPRPSSRLPASLRGSCVSEGPPSKPIWEP